MNNIWEVTVNADGKASQSSAFSNPSLWIIVLVFILMFYFLKRASRKAAAQQEESRKEWFVIGTNVVTTSGFLGKIVDIDGDAVTLESPSGDETVWLKAAISQPMDIPLANVSEEEAEEVADIEEIEEVVLEADTSDTEESTQS